MNRHQLLHDLLIKAVETHEKSLEIEELTRNHKEINSKLREKANAALNKEDNGGIVTEEEQSEINDLAIQQEDAYKKLAEKILKNYGC